MDNLVSKTLKVDEAVWVQLRSLAVAEDRSVSFMARAALAEFVARGGPAKQEEAPAKPNPRFWETAPDDEPELAEVMHEDPRVTAHRAHVLARETRAKVEADRREAMRQRARTDPQPRPQAPSPRPSPANGGLWPTGKPRPKPSLGPEPTLALTQMRRDPSPAVFTSLAPPPKDLRRTEVEYRGKGEGAPDKGMDV